MQTGASGSPFADEWARRRATSEGFPSLDLFVLSHGPFSQPGRDDGRADNAASAPSASPVLAPENEDGSLVRLNYSRTNHLVYLTRYPFTFHRSAGASVSPDAAPRDGQDSMASDKDNDCAEGDGDGGAELSRLVDVAHSASVLVPLNAADPDGPRVAVSPFRRSTLRLRPCAVAGLLAVLNGGHRQPFGVPAVRAPVGSACGSNTTNNSSASTSPPLASGGSPLFPTKPLVLSELPFHLLVAPVELSQPPPLPTVDAAVPTSRASSAPVFAPRRWGLRIEGYVWRESNLVCDVWGDESAPPGAAPVPPQSVFCRMGPLVLDDPLQAAPLAMFLESALLDTFRFCPE